MAKVWKDHFTNTYNGFEKTLRTQKPVESKELSLAEQIKQADELVQKLRMEETKKKILNEDKVRFGNVEYSTYRANKDAIEAKEKGKGKSYKK